ncbi:MAG: transporter substrate-binding domain-containing protein [Sulfurovum sp.]
MIKQLFLVYLLVVTLSISLWSQKVTIYSDCDFKPYSYCEGDKVKGISIDIYKAIFSKIDDYSVEIKGIDLEDGLKKMENSEILMLGTVPYRPKKRAYISDYTESFIYQNEVLYCNRDIGINKPIWPKDFNNTKVAIMKGFNIDESLQNAIDKGYIELVEGEQKENLDNLIYKKVDCYINDAISLKGELLKVKEEFKKSDNNISLDDIKAVLSISNNSYHIGFSNANFPAKNYLIRKINLAIKIMQNSKEIEEIKSRHLKLYLHPEKKITIDVGLYNWGDRLVSQKLNGYGVIPEIVSKAFETEDIAVNYQFHHHHYDYLLTKWGKLCMTVPWLNRGDRERYFYFSDNIKPTAIYFFYNTKYNRKGSIKNDLQLYNIGGIEGYDYKKEVFNNEKTIQYTSFTNWKELIEALLSNKIDVVFAQKERFYSHLDGLLDSEKRLILSNSEALIKQGNYAIFSKKCKNSKELRYKFNRGLRRIKKRGIFNKILKKYNMTIDEFNGIKDNRIDSDSDGVFNAYDKCEDTPNSIKVDETGCERIINPYMMEINYSKNKIIIDGYVLSTKRENELLDKLRVAYPKLAIIDELSIDKGEPEGWIEFISDVTSELKLLIEGSIKISGKDMKVSGKLETIEEKIVFDKRLDKILEKHKSNGYSISPSNIILLNTKIKLCQTKFNTFLDGNKIMFDPATDIIKSENGGLIENLYKIAQLCPKANIHIIGHTDSTGNDVTNNILSLNRAKAVFRKLQEFGISSNKMKAIGEGASIPIADNSTPEGQEKNRRIEFKIIGY